MTNEQMQTIEAAIEEAIRALPNGDDRQLNDWITSHCSFPAEIHEALAEEGVKALIRERARELGVTLKEE
jgi:hypothetical protein